MSGPITSPISTQSTQNVGSRPAGVLEYFDLDHSNPPPICNASNTSASTSNLAGQPSLVTGAPVSNLSHRFSTLGISTPSVFGVQPLISKNETNPIASISLNANAQANAASQPSGIVYKFVDFVKTEALTKTRQDAELARAKNRSKE